VQSRENCEEFHASKKQQSVKRLTVTEIQEVLKSVSKLRTRDAKEKSLPLIINLLTRKKDHESMRSHFFAAYHFG
jgi:hypothetical protein